MKLARKIWLRLHVIFGLYLGILLVTMGLTGSVLAFYKELDAWLNPDLLTLPTSHPNEFAPLSTWMAQISVAAPHLRPHSFTAPYTEDGPFSFWLMEIDGNSEPLPERWHQATVNPYDGSVLGIRPSWGSSGHLGLGRREIIRSIYDLHRSLLLGATGETLVGFSGILLFTSVVSGLTLWWPRQGKLRQAFSYKQQSSLPRKIYDWHKLTGVYSSVVLMVIALSGLYLAFPDYVKPLINLVSTVHQAPEDLKSTPNDEINGADLDECLRKVQQSFQGAKVETLYFPVAPNDVYRLQLQKTSRIGIPTVFGEVILDRFTGKTLFSYNSEIATTGDLFLRWLLPLHSGAAFNTPGRVLVCIIGLMPTILFVTGCIRWNQKRHAKRGISIIKP